MIRYAAFAVLATSVLPAAAQDVDGAGTNPADRDVAPRVAPRVDPEAGSSIDAVLARGVAILLERQEGDENAEWPYEGVYRVERRIPIGYRVGGTALAVSALLRAPGYADDPARQAAVERAVRFICSSREDERMAHPVPEGVAYDVRGWGYACGLDALVELRRVGAAPAGLDAEIDAAIAFLLDGISATEIPEHGGWNYARRGGFDRPGRTSPFMTGLTLQALLAAKQAGLDVDEGVVRRGLDALERGRTVTGSYMYAGGAGARGRESVPGSVGRMLVAETTLMQAGRGDMTRLRGAIDAFLVHWEWLDKRRAQRGTHVKPYGIAPYYFYFAHYYAAQAVALLPEHEREEYRRHVVERIFSARLPDGSWNDRVFDRSAAYGTSMIMRALAGWSES